MCAVEGNDNPRTMPRSPTNCGRGLPVYTSGMESVSLKEARGQLGKIHAAAAHGQPVEITRHGANPVVVVSKLMYDVMFTDHLRWQAEQFRKALDEGTIPEGTLVIRREDVERWRNATPAEWESGRLDA